MYIFYIFIVIAIIFFFLWQLERQKRKNAQTETVSISEQLASVTGEKDHLLSKYAKVIDAEAEAEKIQVEAQNILKQANDEAKKVREDAQKIEADAREAAKISKQDAEKIISDAQDEAKRIALSSTVAKNQAKEYEKTVLAIKRQIEGYGDEWLIPSYSLLDELADEFSYTEAGQKLKEARAASASMVKNGTAADCNYSGDYRRTTAIQFVIDAFNGKVDSILSKVKHDNYGILAQKIKDSFQLVNKNGEAFRKAHINSSYLYARLDELKWATIVQELRKKAADEQRELREKMREEEKARREFERAQREAAKEEAMLKKALEKAQAMLSSANEAQKALYEAQIAEYAQKLKEAEEKNQRALSMAQQTKRGTVYVISNIGAFGENVYKVGMTRRLDPFDRIKELGDASVPFPFDVHAFIESDDAPALETSLHHDLSITQINKVNPRKEFFRVDLSSIKKLVDEKGLDVNWTIAAQAAEYRESLAIEKRIKEDPIERAQWEKFMESVPSTENVEE